MSRLSPEPHAADRPRAPGTWSPPDREGRSFPDSKDDPGLQLADIVASTVTKTLNGKLPATVWRLLGRLLLQRQHDEPVILPIHFGPGDEMLATDHQQYVLKALTNRCKRMLLDDTTPAA